MVNNWSQLLWDLDQDDDDQKHTEIWDREHVTFSSTWGRGVVATGPFERLRNPFEDAMDAARRQQLVENEAEFREAQRQLARAEQLERLGARMDALVATARKPRRLGLVVLLGYVRVR